MARVQLNCVARWPQCLPCLEMELEKKKMEEGVGRIYAENVSTWAATVGWAGRAICRLEPGPVRPVWIQEPHTRWRGNCLVQRFSQLLADHLRPSEIAETTDAGPKLTAPTKRLVGLVAGVWAGPGAGVR